MARGTVRASAGGKLVMGQVSFLLFGPLLVLSLSPTGANWLVCCFFIPPEVYLHLAAFPLK